MTAKENNDSYLAIPFHLMNLQLNKSLFPLETYQSSGPGIVSKELTYVFSIINYVVLCTLVSLCGIVTNCINVAAFMRKGFKETVYISFFWMAVSDLILQLLTLWISVCSNPWLVDAASHFIINVDVMFYIGAWLQVIPIRVTSWITVFVTFERCLCIAMPLKVKSVICPSRVKQIIVFIFIISTLFVIPIFVTFEMQWTFDPQLNRSFHILQILRSRQDVQNVVFYTNNVAFPLVSFILVIIFTTYLSVSINRTSKWRSTVSTSKEQIGKMRDLNVIKMVTAIALVYIACCSPAIGIFLRMAKDVEFSITGRYQNLFSILSSFAFVLECVNSSLNILIYYNMSSQYRETFKSLLSMKKRH